MKWYEIKVMTTQEGLDAVCARFDMLGVTQLEIEESGESIAAFLEDSVKYWDYADPGVFAGEGPCVKAYVADVPENRKLLEDIQTSFEALRHTDVGMDIGSLRLTMLLRDEEDWANNWKLYYKPLEIGEKLLVCPSWEQAQTNGRLLLSMDPGMAFGTGTHHTTRMCLEYLEETVRPGDTLLDLGCGSGILAIAGLLLGARYALGVDVDPIAEKIVWENAAQNGITERSLRVMTGDLLSDAALRAELAKDSYDIVSANIVASVIIALCPYIPGLLKPEGTFIASGIIAERLAEVEAAMAENGLEVLSVHAGEDWRAIRAKKKA